MIEHNMVGRAIGLVVITLFAQLALAFSPVLQTSVSAATEHPQDTLQRWLYYRGMRACLEDGLTSNSELSREDVNKGQWEPATDKDGFGYLAPDMDDNDGNDGTVDCDDGSIWVRGASIFGFADPVELLCEINRGLQKVGDGSRLDPNNKDDCEKSSKFDVTANGKWNEALTKALDTTGMRPAFALKDNPTGDAMRYLIGARSLETFCGAGRSLEDGVDDYTNDENAVIVDIVKSDGTIAKDQTYRLNGERNDENDEVNDVYYNDGGNANEAKDLECDEIAKMTVDNSGAYSKWLLANQDVEPEDEDGGSGGEAAVAETTSCAIDNIGWIVCPVLNFMARIVDVAYTQIATWLSVTPLSTTTSAGVENTMYSSWSVMRNIANVAFVIAFMIIIYSQLTSVGISNYGIKKLLPKIMVAVILVNVSYWVCAIAIDLSNIAGASFYKLFDGDVFSQGIDTSQFAGDISSSGNGWTGLVSALLASAALYLALPALIVALPAALFAIVTVFLVLALRQVLIILLVVISPLAFVALLLPNTEDWFKRWRSLLQTLLLLYPIIAIIFGASAMASTIVMNSAQDVNEDGKMAVQLMGAMITILPLAITPIVLKFGGGVLGKFGGMVNNPNKGPFDAMQKRADKFAGRISNRRAGSGLEGAEDILKGEGGRLGDKNSRRRRVAAAVRSGGRSMAVNAEEKDKYAEIAANGAKRNYVASRASTDEAYAQSLATGFKPFGASDGDKKVAQQVMDYAIQAKADERTKDIKAATARIAKLDNATVASIAASGMHEGKQVSSEVFAAATHRIQESGSFDERMNSLAFLAANKTGELSKSLGMDETLRGEAAQKSIARGDSKILGAGFGNDFVRTGEDYKPENYETIEDFEKAKAREIKGGDITESMAALRAAAVANAEGGSLNAQHLVQADAATKFVVQSVMGSNNQQAQINLKAAADLARSQTSTAAGVTGKIDKAFEAAGSFAQSGNSEPSQTGGGPIQ